MRGLWFGRGHVLVLERRPLESNGEKETQAVSAGLKEAKDALSKYGAATKDLELSDDLQTRKALLAKARILIAEAQDVEQRIGLVQSRLGAKP